MLSLGCRVCIVEGWALGVGWCALSVVGCWVELSVDLRGSIENIVWCWNSSAHMCTICILSAHVYEKLDYRLFRPARSTVDSYCVIESLHSGILACVRLHGLGLINFLSALSDVIRYSLRLGWSH